MVEDMQRGWKWKQRPKESAKDCRWRPVWKRRERSVPVPVIRMDGGLGKLERSAMAWRSRGHWRP